jgi:hypothetical protein
VATYEIQKFQNGTWVVDSIFDDQILAIDAAKGIMGGARPPAAIRVVEESETGGSPRLIFRQTSVDDHNNEATRQKAEIRREVEAFRAVRQAEKTAARVEKARKARKPRKPRKPPPSWRAIAIRSMVLGFLCLGALEALRFYLR